MGLIVDVFDVFCKIKSLSIKKKARKKYFSLSHRSQDIFNFMEKSVDVKSTSIFPTWKDKECIKYSVFVGPYEFDIINNPEIFYTIIKELNESGLVEIEVEKGKSICRNNEIDDIVKGVSWRLTEFGESISIGKK